MNQHFSKAAKRATRYTLLFLVTPAIVFLPSGMIRYKGDPVPAFLAWISWTPIHWLLVGIFSMLLVIAVAETAREKRAVASSTSIHFKLATWAERAIPLMIVAYLFYFCSLFRGI